MGVVGNFKYVAFSHGHMSARDQPENNEGGCKKTCPAWLLAAPSTRLRAGFFNLPLREGG